MLAIVGAVALVVLTVFVATSATRQVDVAARGLFRPDDDWGSTQQLADLVVEGLKPRNIVVLLALVGIGASLRQRSWRPAAYAAAIACIAGALTLFIKLLIQRTDPSYQMSALGGSFPSGHVMSVVVCLGGALLILRERPRWWEWGVVALVGAAMALGMLLISAHWFTDVAGGALVAMTVLAGASASRLRRRSDR